MTYFADAFFYVALFNRHDEYHPRVIEWVEGFVGGDCDNPMDTD